MPASIPASAARAAVFVRLPLWPRANWRPADLAVHRLRVAPRRPAGRRVPRVADGEVALEGGEGAVVEGVGDEPLLLDDGELDAVGHGHAAASWPRCCSANRARYVRWETCWPGATTPTTPHTRPRLPGGLGRSAMGLRHVLSSSGAGPRRHEHVPAAPLRRLRAPLPGVRDRPARRRPRGAGPDLRHHGPRRRCGRRDGRGDPAGAAPVLGRPRDAAAVAARVEAHRAHEPARPGRRHRRAPSRRRVGVALRRAVDRPPRDVPSARAPPRARDGRRLARVRPEGRPVVGPSTPAAPRPAPVGHRCRRRLLLHLRDDHARRRGARGVALPRVDRRLQRHQPR